MNMHPTLNYIQNMHFRVCTQARKITTVGNVHVQLFVCPSCSLEVSQRSGAGGPVVYHSHMASAPPCIGIYNCEATNCSLALFKLVTKYYISIRDCIQHFTQGQNVSLPTTVTYNAPINGICPTLHTWGRCWRKEGDLLSESSPRGQLASTQLRLSQSTQMAYTFSFVVLDLWKILCEFHKHSSPCHTLCMTGRYGVYVRGWYAGLCPRYGGVNSPPYPPIKPQVLYIGRAQLPLIGALILQREPPVGT